MTDEELADLAGQSHWGGRKCWLCCHPAAGKAVADMLDWNERHPDRLISRKVMHSHLVEAFSYPFVVNTLGSHIREHMP